MDEIFLGMPPPFPTARLAVPVSNSGGYGGGALPRAAPVDMSAYYNVGGGCFSGEASVRLADGRVKLARELARGDIVAVPGAAPAAVLCAVHTRCPDGRAALV